MTYSKCLLALAMAFASDTSSFAKGVVEGQTSGATMKVGDGRIFPLSQCRSATAVTIPVRMISNLPIMPGRVNGSRLLNVILDTGAALSIVSPDVATEIGLKSTSSVAAGGFGQGDDQTLHLIDSANMVWGPDHAGLRLASERIAVLPIDYIGAQTGHPVDALFGSNVFQHFRVTVDYAHRSVSFISFQDTCTPSVGAIPIDIEGNVPVVEAEIGGNNGSLVKAKFVVDIGTTGAAILSKRFLEEHPELLAGHSLVAPPPFSAVGGKIEYKLVRLSRIRIGGHDLAGPVAAIPDQPTGILASPGVAGLLGGEILRRFTVTWDYRSRRMWLVPNARLHVPFEADASGLHLIAKGPSLARTYVDGVLAGSPAARAGVQAGDRIISSNGRRQPLWEMARVLMVPGAKVALLVERDGKLLRIIVPLANLV